MLRNIESSWKQLLSEEFEKEYFKNIERFLDAEIAVGKTIYPEKDNIFAAFAATPVENIKVVILGQDPYHGTEQAHGLSFSVQEWVKMPPSLRNIFKELDNEYSCYTVDSENLTHWAKQWVLLLNSILTVEASKPGSHAKCGWVDFTDVVLHKLSESQEWIIFVLWGNFARWKKVLIDTGKHFILESPHPSPFSAHNGFFWNGHFRKINEILKEQRKEEIRW